jgi:hypothetical protein
MMFSAIASLLLIALPEYAHAAIIGVASSTGVNQIAVNVPGTNLRDDNTVTTLLAGANLYQERTLISLGAPVEVNKATSGAWVNDVNTLVTSPYLVNVYYLHADGDSSVAGSRGRYVGSITFTGRIIGVINNSDNPNATNDEFFKSNMFEIATFTYPQGNQHDLEATPNSTRDNYSISSDFRTLTFDFNTNGGNGLDEIRILTAAVPEPASMLVWLGLSSVTGLLVARKRLGGMAQ